VVAGKSVGVLGIAFSFGFALIAMAYGIGYISGCHINPAVSLGFYTAGRMNGKDFIGYVIAQFIGGIVAAAVLSAIATGLLAGYDVAGGGLGQNGWGVGYQGEYSLGSAIIFEFVATLLFVIMILGAMQPEAFPPIAGLAIGITLVVIHIFGINITGVSVNPARSFGPALLVCGKALSRVWMFLIVPSIAGIVAGVLYKLKILGK